MGGTENGDLITTSATTYSYDNYGNAVNVATTLTDNDPESPYTGDTWTTSIANTTDISENQSADLAAWCLNLIDKTITTYTSTAPGSIRNAHQAVRSRYKCIELPCESNHHRAW